MCKLVHIGLTMRGCFSALYHKVTMVYVNCSNTQQCYEQDKMLFRFHTDRSGINFVFNDLICSVSILTIWLLECGARFLRVNNSPIF